MKFEFKNGSTIETIDISEFEGNIRGSRAKNVYFTRPSIKMRFLSFIKKCVGLYSDFQKAKRS